MQKKNDKMGNPSGYHASPKSLSALGRYSQSDMVGQREEYKGEKTGTQWSVESEDS